MPIHELIVCPDTIFLIFRYDSLTGVPSSQRTVAFEKASVLFNVGALYTQIGMYSIFFELLNSLKF